MKSFREHLQTPSDKRFCEQVAHACAELDIDFFEFVDQFLEEQIAQETDPERLVMLSHLYSEGLMGNIMQGIGRGAASAVGNLKKGWQQGMAGATGQQPQQVNPQQQAIEQAWQILNQAGLGQPFQQAFEPILQQIMQQVGAQQGVQTTGATQGNPGANAPDASQQKPSMINQLGSWQRKQQHGYDPQNLQKTFGVQQTAWYTPEGEPLEENDMKTFHQYLESQRLNTLRDNICAGMIHLGVEDYEGFMVEWLAQEYGVEVAKDLTEAGEPFAGKSGWWGNLGKGMLGLGQAGIGTGMAGVGGTMGAGIGGTIGAAKGAFGYSGDPSGEFTVQGGGRDGSHTGRSWMGQGWNAVKDAWGNRQDSAIVSAYRNAQSAVDKFAQAVQAHPALSSDTKLVDAMQKMSKYLMSKGKQVDKIMAQGAQQNAAGASGNPAATGAA